MDKADFEALDAWLARGEEFAVEHAWVKSMFAWHITRMRRLLRGESVSDVIKLPDSFVRKGPATSAAYAAKWSEIEKHLGRPYTSPAVTFYDPATGKETAPAYPVQAQPTVTTYHCASCKTDLNKPDDRSCWKCGGERVEDTGYPARVPGVGICLQCWDTFSIPPSGKTAPHGCGPRPRPANLFKCDNTHGAEFACTWCGQHDWWQRGHRCLG